jgi:arsenate reductase-like glutaredoxin family protein
VDVAERVDARKNTIGRDEAIELARQSAEIIAAKGKSVQRLKTKDAGDEEIAALIVGPTGNLRAPAFTVGKRFLVGFHEDAYREVLT